jgi:hypothetical protein
MPPFDASLFCNFRQIKKMWRKRVGVEPTIQPAKDRIGSFEDCEDHRTPCASAAMIDEAQGPFNFARPHARSGRSTLHAVLFRSRLSRGSLHVGLFTSEARASASARSRIFPLAHTS